jgi:DNA-binding phage protein
MSQSIEFITTINQGVIIIPPQYQGEIEEAQEVQVIIKTQSKNPHQINELAGKVKAFKNMNSVAWQQQIREEWDETRLSN